MKNLKITIILVSAFALFQSCLKQDDYRKPEDGTAELEAYITKNNITSPPSWTGLYMIWSETGTGELPEILDTIEVHYSYTLLDGTVISTHEDEQEGSIKVLGQTNTYGYLKEAYGFYEALGYMRAGDVAKAILPSEIAFYGASNNIVPAFSPIIYNIEVISIRKGRTVEKYYTDTLVKNTTESGLQYFKVLEVDSAEQASLGDKVMIHYSGYLQSGKLFDSSVKLNSPATVVLGYGLMDGFEEGILLMKEGEKMTLIIPPELAYGEYGTYRTYDQLYPFIPPEEILTMDVELIKILD